MKFGIFHELATPRPFTAENESKVLQNALEQVRLADALGFDTVWAVGHLAESQRGRHFQRAATTP